MKLQLWGYCTKCPRIYGKQPLVGDTGLCKVHRIASNHKAYEKKLSPVKLKEQKRKQVSL
jgi:hypothetical protein